MSQAISFEKETLPRLPRIHQTLREIEIARKSKNWTETDALRDSLLAIDSGMEIRYHPNGKVSLWHVPNPAFTDQFHYANVGEFIANSREI